MNLAGDCLLGSSIQTDASLAVQAVNCFAIDLYEHVQDEPGNLFLSPVSIATSLAMAYAGAAGQTAAEMEDVLHLGSEPGIHASFRALLESLTSQDRPEGSVELEVANAMWPAVGFPLRDDFVRTIRTDYFGEARNLDYTNPSQAEEIINSWVEGKTRGKIEDLIDELSAETVMVLTNSFYFRGLWASPFDPRMTYDLPFFRNDGVTIDTPMMCSRDALNDAGELLFPYAEFDGYSVLELPFQGGDASMVFILPTDQNDPNQLTAERLAEVNQWLESPREPVQVDVILPKLKLEASVQLEMLLRQMGMPSAFGFGAADFSSMSNTPVAIDEVRHKVTLEMNEQGTEAAAATSLSFYGCLAAGTPVLTPDGAKPIEQLTAGDYVLARSEHNVGGPVQPKRIEETFQHRAELVDLHVGGRVIRVTKEHRFYVKNRGWTPAAELHVGELLATDSDQCIAIDSVSTPSPVESVFNFRVADHRTYFLGNESWGFAVWTHNSYWGPVFQADHPFHFLIRDNTTSAWLFMGRIDDPLQTDSHLRPMVRRIPGDSNGDGVFNSADLVRVLQSGKYEDGIPRNATFEEGDWNGDADFDSSDFVLAFQTGLYEVDAQPSIRELAAAADWLFAQGQRPTRPRAYVG